MTLHMKVPDSWFKIFVFDKGVRLSIMVLGCSPVWFS